ncbi:DNA topology modulation protein [Bradyrhizobium australafricanum]|uniref:DNA topology modulation protein n=1 Tax=Bradyrhizobium australafricanum TaxID=2821406 RepID=UPI001CE347FC|nr:DNA topology modulation protein [Bradyrhizobium australafricanum]MCA6101619.1 DNA topology modulation protein [Bradyrhizobium australafricanum]
MQRVLVMGSSGSGKSTFARRLSAMTGIPAVSIDALFWKPGWVESGRDEFARRMTEAAPEPRWIMDGNYMRHGAGQLRRELSDTIIWFDLPRSTCMLGIFRRIAGSYGEVRPEMAEGCPEKIDLEFFRYVWTYRRQQRPKLIEYFAGLRPDQSLVCFTDRAQADDYLKRLALGQNRASIH